MKIRFTKMQGAGNDFVVLDETRSRLNLSAGQYRFLADRHFGVGADQILTVRPAPEGAGQGLDFEYVIHNADGGEVEHCGNGARCFVRYVREKGLTAKDAVKVKVVGGVLELRQNPDGRVTVDMGAPVFDLPRIPFDPAGLEARSRAAGRSGRSILKKNKPSQRQLRQLCFGSGAVDGQPARGAGGGRRGHRAGADQGPLIERHPAFPRRVNAGFMQVVSRSARPPARVRARRRRDAGLRHRRLRRGGGRHPLGLLDPRVDVQTRGGR
jgi:diaminopimelate epimerase